VALQKVIDLVLVTTCVVFSTKKAMVYPLREKKKERKRVEWRGKKESGVVRKYSGVVEEETVLIEAS